MKGIILAIWLGWAGAYRFYKKQKGMGVLYLLTLGLFGVGWIIDIVTSIKDYMKKKNAFKTFRFDVAGLFAYEENLKKLQIEVKKYKLDNESLVQKGKGRTYRYKYPTEASLVPEPTNQYDKNAIMVLIDGLQIGHVPAAYCLDVKQIIKKGKNVSVSAWISGGEYKEVVNDNVYPNFEDLKCKVEVKYQ